MDKWLRNNNIIRIVAVLVGLLLWVIVRLDVQNSTGPSQPTTVSQTYTNQTIQVVGLDEERYTLLSYEPNKVSITVIGTAAALRRIQISDYRVLLNLTDVPPGEHLVSLTYEGFPSNVQVVLDPPNVAVTLDEKERKEVPVTINLIGSPADGYTAGDPVTQPNRVNVTVESSLASQVASVVGLVDIEGATATVKQQVKLVALDADGTELDVDVSPAVVDVEVPITSPFKTVPLQVALTGSTPPGYAVAAFEQSVTEVTLFGPQAFLNSIEFYEGMRIDLSGLTETRTFEFDVPLLDGVERVEPGRATAKVTIVPAVEETLAGVPLTPNGERDGLAYAIAAPDGGTVDVVVEGAPDILAQLEAGEVAATIDVSGLAPGEHTVPIGYSLPAFVELADGSPTTATVVVEAAAEEASAAPDGSAGDEPAAGEDGAGSDEAGEAGGGATGGSGAAASRSGAASSPAGGGGPET